ncbi:MAG: alkene reductase [Ignavibacteriae bacterium HGW-Ignavibacteriae-1]|jgi:N-ethylmaleimide reductase|nr:MAG: alkene reductase [Ignavibacteriae bacterium HGW-Ignavibacteriae-1]
MTENMLFESYKYGGMELKNRLVMAAMTRSRSFERGVPHELASLYYTQRASAGLIITEGTEISPKSSGYLWCPGIYTEEQITSWAKIVKAVHKKGGNISMQLWHTGRISHSDFHGGMKPPAPSAIAAIGKTYTNEGWKEFSEPQEMSRDEIKSVINDYKTAAKNAMEAGFDGIEIHGAFGYLPDQFLCSGSNQRSDEYGGSVENRARFVIEIIEAIAEVMDSQRIGIKLSPSNIGNSMSDENPTETFGYLIKKLNDYNLGHIQLMEADEAAKKLPNYVANVAAHFRKIYKGTLISNNNHNRKTAIEFVESGKANLISFARWFLANPDLPERFRLNTRLNEPIKKTFYGGGAEGYVDYPFL